MATKKTLKNFGSLKIAHRSNRDFIVRESNRMSHPLRGDK